MIALGFESEEGEYAEECVSYRFGHLKLLASRVHNVYAREIVLLSGVIFTGRTMGEVNSQIPTDLETPEEAAAWISYVLRSDKRELAPLPGWFEEGERNWDLIPFVREANERQRTFQERQRAYESCPKCVIARESARILRREIRAALSQTNNEEEMEVQFDGQVLRIDLDVVHGYDEYPTRLHESVAATGTAWPALYRVAISRDTTALPDRFAKPLVEVSLFEGNLCMDQIALGPYQSAE